MKASVVVASGSDETDSYTPREVALISEAIKGRGINVLDVIRALDAPRLPRGGGEPALRRQAARLRRLSADLGDGAERAGDQRGQRSQRLCGPRHRLPRVGGAAAGDRRHPRRARSATRCSRRKRPSPASSAAHCATAAWGRPRVGADPRRGRDRRQPGLRGEALPDACRTSAIDGAAQGAGRRHRRKAAACRASCACGTRPTPRSLACRRRGLSGSGVGIGIQAKGTAVIHQADRLPHNNLELFSNAPITSARSITARSAPTLRAYAQGEMPEPVVVPTARRGDGRALSCAGGADLRHRDVADRRRRAAGGDRDRPSRRRRHERAQADGVADYPLAEKRPELVRGRGGKPLDELTLEAVSGGRRDPRRISGSRRRRCCDQAEIARDAGRPTLAANFERAAELVDVPQDVIMQVYELLRPGRAKDKAPLLDAAEGAPRDLQAPSAWRISSRRRRGL